MILLQLGIFLASKLISFCAWKWWWGWW